MIYKQFKIVNFKGIDKVTINLENNRVITLVGLNESGKTSIMEGIHLFYRMIKGDQIPQNQLNEFRPKGIDFTGNITISSILKLDEKDKKKIETYWSEKLNKRTSLEIPNEYGFDFQFYFDLHSYIKDSRTCAFPIKTKNSQRTLYDTDKSSWHKIVDYVKSDLVPEVLYYDDFIFQIPKKICFLKTGIPEQVEVNDKNNKIWQLVVDDVLKVVNERMNFQNQIVDIWETDRDAANNRLAQMEKVLNEKITNRWASLFGKKKINFKEIILEPEFSEGKFYLSFKIRTQSNKEFIINERSKGFKWFFSFLLFTEFRKKRTKNILFLIDEPASNLHSSAQAKILDAIQELISDSLVIFSTHSQYLIKPDWLSGAYICINEKLSNAVLEGSLNVEEGAKITAIKYYRYVGAGYSSDNVSYFQPILNALDYKPSIVEPIPNIIILEGKNDWYTLQYFGISILKRKRKLHFYPGAGKDKLYDIIRLYMSWGKHFIVLLDGDDGIKSKGRYQKEFGEYVKNKIFTLKDVINKPVAMEKLISVMDQKNIYDDVFGKGSYNECKKNNNKKIKENLNFALNQLQLYKKNIKISKITENNFLKLFIFLENKAIAVN